MRKLTRMEVHDLRPCTGTPFASAPISAQLAAINAGFVQSMDQGYAQDMGFQVACVCAMQGGELNGRDFPTLLASSPVTDGVSRYDHAIWELVGSMDTVYMPMHLPRIALQLVRDGHRIDIRALHRDLTDWFTEDRAPVRRWVSLLGPDYERIKSRKRNAT